MPLYIIIIILPYYNIFTIKAGLDRVDLLEFTLQVMGVSRDSSQTMTRAIDLEKTATGEKCKLNNIIIITNREVKTI